MSLSNAAVVLTSPLVHVPASILVFVLLKKFHTQFPAKPLTIAALIWFFCCCGTYTSSALIHRLEYTYPPIHADSHKWATAETVVVLGCYYFDADLLPPYNRWPRCSLQRLLQAIAMYKYKPNQIVVSGGNLADWPKTLAEYSREFLVQQGIPNKSISVVNNGFNTRSEVSAICEKLEVEEIALVTSASHQLRATREFQKCGIKVTNIPVDFLTQPNIKFEISLPNADSLKRSERAIHEYLGLIAQYFS